MEERLEELQGVVTSEVMGEQSRHAILPGFTMVWQMLLLVLLSILHAPCSMLLSMLILVLLSMDGVNVDISVPVSNFMKNVGTKCSEAGDRLLTDYR